MTDGFDGPATAFCAEVTEGRNEPALAAGIVERGRGGASLRGGKVLMGFAMGGGTSGAGGSGGGGIAGAGGIDGFLRLGESADYPFKTETDPAFSPSLSAYYPTHSISRPIYELSLSTAPASTHESNHLAMRTTLRRGGATSPRRRANWMMRSSCAHTGLAQSSARVFRCVSI